VFYQHLVPHGINFHVSPFQGEDIFWGDVDPGRRGVPLALGCYVPALQAEEVPGNLIPHSTLLRLEEDS